jgi:hypothetical protein
LTDVEIFQDYMNLNDILFGIQEQMDILKPFNLCQGNKMIKKIEDLILSELAVVQLDASNLEGKT